VESIDSEGRIPDELLCTLWASVSPPQLRLDRSPRSQLESCCASSSNKYALTGLTRHPPLRGRIHLQVELPRCSSHIRAFSVPSLLQILAIALQYYYVSHTYATYARTTISFQLLYRISIMNGDRCRPSISPAHLLKGSNGFSLELFSLRWLLFNPSGHAVSEVQRFWRAQPD
jgi:hypothetical protein